jgi:membrane protein YqaA with SNARE-associated domain
MRSFFNTFVGYFLSPPGLVLMSALDTSLVFFLPLGIDLAVVLVTAAQPDRFWLYALLATMGSLIGASATFWVGRKAGEHGLTRLVPAKRLDQVKRRVSGHAAVTTALLGVIPPPFPYKVFILVSAAVGANYITFITTLAGVRFVRFLTEAWLASRYGKRILTWMESAVFEWVVGLLIVGAIGGTIVSAIVLYRRMKQDGSGRDLRAA